MKFMIGYKTFGTGKPHYCAEREEVIIKRGLMRGEEVLRWMIEVPDIKSLLEIRDSVGDGEVTITTDYETGMDCIEI